MYKSPEKKSFRGNRSLSHLLDIVTKPVFIKRGFAENRIITDWSKIVGESMASCSVPRKLSFLRDQKSNGTLYIEVSNSGFATEMVYLEPMILEKIACYFGYKAVSRLKIQQNPKNPLLIRAAPVKKKKISADNNTKLELSLEGIDDEELKESLRQLGQGILAE